MEEKLPTMDYFKFTNNPFMNDRPVPSKIARNNSDLLFETQEIFRNTGLQRNFHLDYVV